MTHETDQEIFRAKLEEAGLDPRDFNLTGEIAYDFRLGRTAAQHRAIADALDAVAENKSK